MRLRTLGSRTSGGGPAFHRSGTFSLAAKSDKRDVLYDVVMRDPITATPFPLRVRVFSGDLFILTEVFFDECYRLPARRAVDGEGQVPRRILDLGGNIGLSAAYFLARFPDVEVFPVEPDAGNFDLLQKNTAQFGNRARALRAAVSPRPGSGRIRPATAAHSLTVEAVEDADTGEANFPLMTIPQILEQAGWDKVDVIKMDIEGFEWQVFDAGCDWLQRCDLLLCEFHGEREPRTLGAAAAAQGFRLVPPNSGSQWAFLKT